MSVGQSKVEHNRSSCMREESVVRDPTGSGAHDDAVLYGPDGSNELRDRGQRSSNVDTTKLNIVGSSCADHAGNGSGDNVETGRERVGSQPHGCATPSPVPFHQVTEPVKVSTDHRDGTTSPERAAAEEEDNERHNAVAVAAAASHVKSNASNNAGRYDVSVNDSRATVRNAVQGAVKTHIDTGRMVGFNREGELIHNTEHNTDPTPSSTTVSANGSGGRVHPRIDIDHSYSVPLHPTHSLDSPMTNSEMQVVASPSHFRSHAESPYEYSYPYARRLERHPDDLESHTPVLYKQEWRRDSYSDHAMTPLPRPVDRSTVPHGPPHSPMSTYGMMHRPSLPDLSAAPEPDPTVTGGYVPQGGRLVPAAFFAGDSSRGSGSSAASSPPNGTQEPRYSPSSHNIIAPSPHYPVQPLDATQLDDEPPYEPSYTPFPPNIGPTSAMRPYEGESVYYQAYGSEVTYTPVHSHYDLHRRGSTSPVPSISGSKRMRVADWDDSRELQRRRLSYSQSISVAPGIQQYRPPLSPTLSTTSGVGLSRVGGEIAPPSLREMGIRDAIGESLHRTPGAINGLPELDDFARDRSRADTSYSFIALPGNTVRKRPRRKFEEITRNYACNWPDCAKAYGTLNHLNAHVIMQKHGPKRTPAEFKELRKLWRKQKRDQQSQHQPPRSVQYQQDANNVFNDAETIHLDDDDASPYNGSV
ncbi:hypothetical protein FRC17_004116 [Serendipita sp. 399]|nr:hypothetical protein FRC17_004116 [Serendipita sp. 399]